MNSIQISRNRWLNLSSIKEYEYTDVLIINIILFLYPFEFFDLIHQGALGAISPFRIVILPLCLYYLAKYLGKSRTKVNDIDLVAIVSLFFFSFLSSLNTGTLESSFSIVGNIVQLLMAYVFFRRSGIGIKSLYIITSWCLLQIPVLIFSIYNGQIGMTMRFHGWFFDPNYLCSFVLGSICAAYYLLQNARKRWLKLYSLTIIVMGLIMIFLSFSRGGLIGLFLIVFLFLFCNHKRVLLILLSFLIPIVSALVIRAQYLTWSDAADNLLDAFLYRTITLSEDASELTSHRTEFIDIFFNNLDDFLFMGTDLDYYIKYYNNGTFPHNGFIELLIQGGLIVGTFYIFRLVFCIIKEIFMTTRYKAVPCELLIGLGILTPLTFLSYTSKIAWLCMGIIFALAQRTIFKSHI